MADWKSWSDWFDASALPFVPPSMVGAFIGWSYAREQTLKQRAVSFLISGVFSAYTTAAIAENLHWGKATLAIVAILGAVVGMDIIGGIVVAARAWKLAPFDTFARWWGLIRPAGTAAVPPIDQPPPQGGDPMRRDS